MRAKGSIGLSDKELVERQTPGWLIPYLEGADNISMSIPPEVVAPGKPEGLRYDYTGHGRWTWWIDACMAGEVPLTPIPPVTFLNSPDPNDAKEIQNLLRPVIAAGLGGYDDAWLLFVRWMLYGLAYKPDEMQVERIPEKIRAEWYASFNIFNLLHSPCDWSAFILQHGLSGDKGTRAKHTGSGFFSTPMNLCNVMTDLTMGGKPTHEHKYQTVLDPCCGTGSMLLPASNYSLRLFGQDIVLDLCLCTILNGYLWMPWMVAMPDDMRSVLEAGRTEQRSLEVSAKGITPEIISELQAAAIEGALTQMRMPLQ